MNIERHFHHIVMITRNCAVAAAVRASHSRCLGATVGMICVVFVYWLTGCLFVCAFACVFGMARM